MGIARTPPRRLWPTWPAPRLRATPFPFRRESCAEMISLVQKMQPYVVHVAQFRSLATKLHATLMDAQRLLMQCTKGWKKLDTAQQKDRLLDCCKTLAVFLDCKGRWGKRIYKDDGGHQYEKIGAFDLAEECYRKVSRGEAGRLCNK